jgi:hypothetical protein
MLRPVRRARPSHAFIEKSHARALIHDCGRTILTDSFFTKSLREIRTGDEQHLKGSKDIWSRMENAFILYRCGLCFLIAVDFLQYC